MSFAGPFSKKIKGRIEFVFGKQMTSLMNESGKVDKKDAVFTPVPDNLWDAVQMRIESVEGDERESKLREIFLPRIVGDDEQKRVLVKHVIRHFNGVCAQANAMHAFHVAVSETFATYNKAKNMFSGGSGGVTSTSVIEQTPKGVSGAGSDLPHSSEVLAPPYGGAEGGVVGEVGHGHPPASFIDRMKAWWGEKVGQYELLRAAAPVSSMQIAGGVALCGGVIAAVLLQRKKRAAERLKKESVDPFAAFETVRKFSRAFQAIGLPIVMFGTNVKNTMKWLREIDAESLLLAAVAGTAAFAWNEGFRDVVNFIASYFTSFWDAAYADVLDDRGHVGGEQSTASPNVQEAAYFWIRERLASGLDLNDAQRVRDGMCWARANENGWYANNRARVYDNFFACHRLFERVRQTFGEGAAAFVGSRRTYNAVKIAISAWFLYAAWEAYNADEELFESVINGCSEKEFESKKGKTKKGRKRMSNDDLLQYRKGKVKSMTTDSNRSSWMVADKVLMQMSDEEWAVAKKAMASGMTFQEFCDTGDSDDDDDAAGRFGAAESKNDETLKKRVEKRKKEIEKKIKERVVEETEKERSSIATHESKDGKQCAVFGCKRLRVKGASIPHDVKKCHRCAFVIPKYGGTCWGLMNNAPIRSCAECFAMSQNGGKVAPVVASLVQKDSEKVTPIIAKRNVSGATVQATTVVAAGPVTSAVVADPITPQQKESKTINPVIAEDSPIWKSLFRVMAVNPSCHEEDLSDVTMANANMKEACIGFAAKGKLVVPYHVVLQHPYSTREQAVKLTRLIFIDANGKRLVVSVASGEKNELEDFIKWPNQMSAKDVTPFVPAAPVTKWRVGSGALLSRVGGVQRVHPGYSSTIRTHDFSTEAGYSGGIVVGKLVPTDKTNDMLAVMGMHVSGGKGTPGGGEINVFVDCDKIFSAAEVPGN